MSSGTFIEKIYIMLYTMFTNLCVCIDKTIEIITDDDNVLQSIYYQDSTMKAKFLNCS